VGAAGRLAPGQGFGERNARPAPRGPHPARLRLALYLPLVLSQAAPVAGHRFGAVKDPDCWVGQRDGHLPADEAPGPPLPCGRGAVSRYRGSRYVQGYGIRPMARPRGMHRRRVRQALASALPAERKRPHRDPPGAHLGLATGHGRGVTG
jgi:hypothetical protein